MKYITLFILAIAAICGECTAQPHGYPPPPRRMPPRIDKALIAPFKAEKMVAGRKTIRFRIATIAGESDNAPALVVYLHGKSASGNDNFSQMGNRGIYAIYDYLKTNNTSAVMLIPQCPENYTWSETDGREDFGKNRQYNRYVKALIDSCIVAKNIDRSRVYVLGSSMGGFGTYGMIRDYPDTFAAAFCASGGVLRSGKRSGLVHTPVFFTVGSGEGRANAALYRGLVHDLNANGGEANFDELEGFDHRQACSGAYTAERLQWVFSHKKSSKQ